MGASRAGSRRDIAVLWGVNAVDGLGSQASGLVFPLLLLDLGHGPGTAGLFASSAALAGVLLGPVVAVPSDRGHRRRLMTGAAVLAALAMAGLAVSCLCHPPLSILLGLAFTERLCATAYETAARGSLRLLSSPDDLPRAVAGLQAGDQAALVLGPALGGVLFGVSRFLPFAVDAVSYAAAALGVRAIRTPLDPTVLRADTTRSGGAEPKKLPAGPSTAEAGPSTAVAGPIALVAEVSTAVTEPIAPVAEPKTPVPSTPGTPAAAAPGTSMAPPGTSSYPPDGRPRTPRQAPAPSTGALRAGLVAVVRSPVLRLVLLWSSVASGVLALLFYTAVFVLGTGAGGAATGGVLAASGAAGLVGSLVAARVVRRFGAHRSLTAATWLLLVPCAALSAADGPWPWGLCFCALCLVLPVVTVVLSGAAVLAVPQDLQSRTGAVLGSATAVTAAVAPALS
ncbi:MFS transporter, partial [Streptomyces sp. NPDC020362]|uniref:MFS transporter n=1 Tax=Streptomyces sp. NPDC020362 TaxID=3154486 RepID=UPI0033CEE762